MVKSLIVYVQVVDGCPNVEDLDKILGDDTSTISVEEMPELEDEEIVDIYNDIGIETKEVVGLENVSIKIDDVYSNEDENG